MIEFDTRKEAKQRAEFITPPLLRQFIARKVKGDNLNILDTSIGSGQLLFSLKDRIKKITGFDVNEYVLNVAKINFADIENNIHLQDFITADIKEQFDVTITNYPFSLKPTDEQKEAIANDEFLSGFYKQKKGKANVTGVLDFPFILKSFHASKEGHYLAFPGIGYRSNELQFRKYLIDNKFVREFGIIENCKFEHTAISILYLHLSKVPCDNPKAFRLDLKTNELIEDNADLEDYTFKAPHKEIEVEQIDLTEVTSDIRAMTENYLVQTLKMELLTYNEFKTGTCPKVWFDGMIERIKRDIFAEQQHTL